MDPIFTEEQLNRMSREDMCSLLKLMQQHQQKQEEALQRQEVQTATFRGQQGRISRPVRAILSGQF